MPQSKSHFKTIKCKTFSVPINNYHTINAARGNTIYYRKPCLLPDTDEDGDIDMEEIYEWEDLKDVQGEPEYSDEGGIGDETFIDIPPYPHHELALSTSATGNVLLTWSRSDAYDCAGYKIYRALQDYPNPPGDFEYTYTINDPEDTDYIDYDFEPGEGNDGAAYKITAFDNRGHESDYSNTVSSHGEIVPQSEGDLSGMLIIDNDSFLASPNPFNPSTTLSFTLPQSGAASLIVFDIQGQEVARLVNGFQPAGSHSVTFDGSDLSSGIYFARLQAGNFTGVQKLLLIK